MQESEGIARTGTSLNIHWRLMVVVKSVDKISIPTTTQAAIQLNIISKHIAEIYDERETVILSVLSHLTDSSGHVH